MGTIAGKPETADKTPGFEAGWEMVGGRRAGNANGDAEPGRDQRFALWHSQNAARGAESHANADFLAAAGDVVREHSIETDRGERAGRQPEDCCQARHEAILVEIVADLFIETHQVRNRYVRINACERFADDGFKR